MRSQLLFLLFLAVALVFAGCGDAGDDQSIASIGNDTDSDFIRAKQAQIEALQRTMERSEDFTEPDIIVVNFEQSGSS